MIVTEKQARQYWCPMSRVQYQLKRCMVAVNRLSQLEEDDMPIGTGCLGSMCMMWRWHGAPGARRVSAHGADRLAEGLLPDEASREPNPEERMGSCGLARND